MIGRKEKKLSSEVYFRTKKTDSRLEICLEMKLKLLDFDDLHHVCGTLTCRVACRDDDQLAWLDTVILGEERGEVIIVGELVLYIGEDR